MNFCLLLGVNAPKVVRISPNTPKIKSTFAHSCVNAAIAALISFRGCMMQAYEESNNFGFNTSSWINASLGDVIHLFASNES